MPANSVVLSTPAQRFLSELSNIDADGIGTCQVCSEERELTELFPEAPGGGLRDRDRVVCRPCLALGAIAAAVGAKL